MRFDPISSPYPSDQCIQVSCCLAWAPVKTSTCFTWIEQFTSCFVGRFVFFLLPPWFPSFNYKFHQPYATYTPSHDPNPQPYIPTMLQSHRTVQYITIPSQIQIQTTTSLTTITVLTQTDTLLVERHQTIM